MNGLSLLENVFAWAMIAGGLAILISVRWRPMKLWHSGKSRRYASRKQKRAAAPPEPFSPGAERPSQS